MLKSFTIVGTVILVLILLGFLSDDKPQSMATPAPVRIDPVEFTPTSKELRPLKVKHVEVVRPDLSPDVRWPFVNTSVVIACASPSMNVLKVDSPLSFKIYAALNGQASSWSDRYNVKESNGEVRSIISARSNSNFKVTRIVVDDAPDEVIGHWWSLFNARLNQICK